MKRKRIIALYLIAGCQLCSILAAADNISAQDKGRTPPASIQFEKAYNMLERADEARDNEKLTEAIKLYQEALDSYIRLAKKYPDWESGITRFRITYCNTQLELLLKEIDKKSLQNASVPGQAAEAVSIDAITSTAKLLLKKKETAKARQFLLKGLLLDPDDKTVRLLMGIVHCQASEFENAMHILKQLIEEDPSNAAAHVILGTAYFGLAQLQDAVKEMERAIELNPGLHEAHYNLAQILMAITPPDLNAARNHYRKALELGSKPDKKLDSLLK